MGSVHESGATLVLVNDNKSPVNSSNESAIYAAVKRYSDAWAANDLAAIVNCYHDDVVFH